MTVTVTATPDSLILSPGGSAQVTVAVNPNSPYGFVTVPIDVEVRPPYDYLISGDTALTIGPGKTGYVTGGLSLTSDLVVDGGWLGGVNAFTLEGNGFQILVQHGGQVDWRGIPKSGWVPWGTDTVGWQSGDRLAISPTQAGVYVPTEGLWTDDWATLIRPAVSPDLELLAGQLLAVPEVGNLTRSIELRNLRRFHFHDDPGVQTLKHLAIVNSGVAGVLGDYPLHFHLCGESARGSLVEGVVVEGGKNHAFVPHGSHGITFRDDIAYNTTGDAYWYDLPLGDVDNSSNDILYDHCLASWVVGGYALAGFLLGAGVGNRCIDSVAVAVQGDTNSSGFHWPSKANQRPNLWTVLDLIAHNNKHHGVFIWQNDPNPHVVEHFIIYNNRLIGIDHGAYNNRYTFRDIKIAGSPIAVRLHALSHLNAGPQIWERVHTDGLLVVFSHNLTSPEPTIIRESTFTGVTYDEWSANKPPNSGQPSQIHHENGGLTPTDFTLTRIHSGSVIELWENGLLQHRRAAGGWS